MRFRASRRASFVWLICLSSAALVAGCASYTARPIDAREVASEQRSRTIDLDAVRAELERVAPGYVWRDGEWNQVTLLAAALVTNPALSRARATVDAARAEAAAARVSPGPSFSLTGEYTTNPPEPSPWLYGLASDLFLDRGGRRQGRIENADVAAEIAEYDYAAAVWGVRAAIRKALDARFTWQAEASIAHDLVTTRQREFEAVSRRVAAGEVSRLDLDRVRADAARDARTEATARNNVTSAGLDLAAAVGVPLDALDLDHEHLVPAELGGLQSRSAVTDIELTTAFMGRSEILRASANYDRAEAALKTAVASQYPQIHIGPGYTWERGLRKWPLLVSFALPTNDHGRAGIKAAEARRAEAGRQLEAAVAAVSAGIDRAEADYDAAWTVLGLVRDQTLPTADALARQADAALAAGTVNRADWAASQAGYLTARLDEIVAIRTVLEREAALEDALQQPLRGPETALGTFGSPPTGDSR